MDQVAPSGFEAVSCNICASTSTRVFARRQGMQVAQCRGCGLVYVNPRLNARSLHQHYNSGESSRMQYYLDVEAADRRSFTEMLALAAKHVPGRGTLLDIGPNIGTALTVARSLGWKARGIEINAQAAEFCRKERGLDVVAGVLDERRFAPGTFDVVLMGDVIEHLPDPYDLMCMVRNILTPSGVVLISTPNVASWAGRTLQMKPTEHIYLFSPATITKLLDKAGLEVVHMGPLDRYHNVTRMTHSTTFGGLFQALKPLFRLSHRLFGDVVVKLPLRENLLAVARRKTQSQVEAA